LGTTQRFLKIHGDFGKVLGKFGKITTTSENSEADFEKFTTTFEYYVALLKNPKQLWEVHG
jgi:hypothetical protein